VAHCGCQERVVEDAYHMAPAGLNFGVGPSYAAGMSSASAGHDEDVPDFSSLLAVSL
jgi:hypothetical protein